MLPPAGDPGSIEICQIVMLTLGVDGHRERSSRGTAFRGAGRGNVAASW